jgi:hypothetical protein
LSIISSLLDSMTRNKRLVQSENKILIVRVQQKIHAHGTFFI